MAADALQQLGDQAAALLQQLSATERRKLAAELARTMRATQTERIRANKQPDGTAMTPRKPQPRLRDRRGGHPPQDVRQTGQACMVQGYRHRYRGRR
ncbi:phage virion morphogenesis protein [Aeromonas veronii]|uniref:phage virion morphogenesis protein n=1 Tax=Aeromonas veronii TaxID=654 RepID=UPI0024435CF3|nr:phage virion morphogenesis protein [Aeromonas veronii]